MKQYFPFLVAMFVCFAAGANVPTFVGSTPAHDEVRDFLQISLSDSTDFIRWKLQISSNTFKVECHYGLAKPGTPGFINERSVAFEGGLTKSNAFYSLTHAGKTVSILEVNANVLHFLDHNNQMLIGNGGYSYALNSTYPVEADAVNIRSVQTSINGPLVFEGRTPCSDLPALLGVHKSDACIKMKWYFLLYTDSVTGKPSSFLMGGIGYRKETMAKGKWQIKSEGDGRIIYQLFSDEWTHPLTLLKGDDNILFFIDGKGHLLVGNEDFSYTLNRRAKEYPPRL